MTKDSSSESNHVNEGVDIASENKQTPSADAMQSADNGGNQQNRSNLSAEQTMTDKNAADQQQAVSKNEPIIIKQGGGKGMAFGAVVLSLLALGASGFLFVQGQNALKSIDTIWSQKINNAGLEQSENGILLKKSQQEQEALQKSLLALQQLESKNQADLEKMGAAYQELMKGRDAWLVNETEYALNIANQQLLLSGNVPGATVALESLLNRLNQFDKPQLLPIKKAISEDLANLKNTAYVDVTSAALRLDRLESAVSGLPLVIDSTMKSDAKVTAKVVAPTIDANASWWEKAWAQIKDTLGGLVQVREIDNKDAMLISPEQSYFVRENLRLRLIDARIALMQRQSDVYRNDLDNIETTIDQYFDKNNENVKAWLAELAKLKSLNLQNNLTSDLLKNSLGAVNQYQEQVLGERIALPEVVLTPNADAASQVKIEDATASDVTASAAKAPANTATTEPNKGVDAQKGHPL